MTKKETVETTDDTLPACSSYCEHCNYAMRGDFLCDIDDNVTIVDWKPFPCHHPERRKLVDTKCEANRIEELIALINAERKRQEECDDVHLRKIAELEKENAELKTVKIPQLERKIASIRGAHSVDCKKLKARTEQVERLKKENAELKEKLAGAERTRDRLVQLGFPTFQSCREYADKINYAKAIIQDLLNNSDEYARQIAMVWLEMC